MKLPTFSLIDGTQNNSTESSYQELLNKAEEQYGIAEQLYWLFQETLDFDFRDLYILQMARYASQIRRIRQVNSDFIRLKCQEVLVAAETLWAEHTLNWVEKTGTDGSKVLEEQGLTAEVVAMYTLLLDTAQALGWKPPMPKVEHPSAVGDPVMVIAQETARRTNELLAGRGWCLWKCAALDNDLIAVVRDEFVKGVPEGYPVYTEDELKEMFRDGVSATTIKLIHEAKKLTGAIVVDVTELNPLPNENRG